MATRTRRRRRRRAPHENRHRYRENRYRPRRRRNVRRPRRRYSENVGRPRRRRYRDNYRRRARYRSNVGAMAPSIQRPQTWVVPAIAAGTGAATAVAAARMVLGPGATPAMSYLVEAGTGLAGWMILPMTGLVRPSTGFLFAIGAMVPIVSDIVSRYVFRAIGLSAYAYDMAGELADMGQEPRFPPTLSAYAYELSDMGNDDTMGELAVGAYGGGSAWGYGGAMPRAPWETAGPAGY